MITISLTKEEASNLCILLDLSCDGGFISTEDSDLIEKVREQVNEQYGSE